MCSIYGWTGNVPSIVKKQILETANERGRDGWGVEYDKGEVRALGIEITKHPKFYELLASETLVGNHRATPTTESESRENNLQPYGGIFHNGIIANDEELNGGTKPEIDSMVLPKIIQRNNTDGPSELKEAVEKIKGSFAIAFTCAFGDIMLACNYKPIYYRRFDHGFAFASMPEMLIENAIKMKPYSVLTYRALTDYLMGMDLTRKQSKKVMVSASSGLDSTVVAYMLKKRGHDVELVHFTYGCVAESREINRIKAIAFQGNFPLRFVELPKVLSGSIVEGKYHQEGIEGTEYAHDWVSARNLLMLSILTAMAETHGAGYIAFGGNLEESGSYPDNESEFGRMFNAVLPYATQNGVKIELLQPVGNLMKHEIVQQGISAGAALDLTWSCYGGGEHHCGKCGPCFMRKTAFERNGIKDPVQYV